MSCINIYNTRSCRSMIFILVNCQQSYFYNSGLQLKCHHHCLHLYCATPFPKPHLSHFVQICLVNNISTIHNHCLHLFSMLVIFVLLTPHLSQNFAQCLSPGEDSLLRTTVAVLLRGGQEGCRGGTGSPRGRWDPFLIFF